MIKSNIPRTIYAVNAAVRWLVPGITGRSSPSHHPRLPINQPPTGGQVQTQQGRYVEKELPALLPSTLSPRLTCTWLWRDSVESLPFPALIPKSVPFSYERAETVFQAQ